MPSAGLDAQNKLTNEDFRKLMMTPRSTGSAASALAASIAAGGGLAGPQTPTTPKSGTGEKQSESTEKAEKRKKKKSFYAKLKRQEDDKMAELAAKYRDRAKERRDGGPTIGLDRY
jgi:IK cytokine